MVEVIKCVLGAYLNLMSFIAPKICGKHAFFLFCIPFKAKLNPKQQAFLADSEVRSLTVAGRKVQTYKWGTGPRKVFMVHGWQSHSYRWKPYIDRFDTNRYSIYSLDAPGHGNSEGLFGNVPLYEQSLKAMCDEFGLPDCFIAHSIGSFSTQYFLAKNNIQTKKLVSLASPFSAAEFTVHFKTALNLGPGTMKHLDDYFKFYTGHHIEYFSLSNFSPHIEAQTLIIHDKSDRDTPSSGSVKMNDLFPNSELFITEGLGHKLKSAEVFEKVMAFIDA